MIDDSNFLCYIKTCIIWFSHAIRLVKSIRQLVVNFNPERLSGSFFVSDLSDR